MSSAVITHPSLPKTTESVMSGVSQLARPRPGPWWLFAAFGLVPLAVVAALAFLAPAAALVTAFAVMVVAACALAVFGLEMATDEDEA